MLVGVKCQGKYAYQTVTKITDWRHVPKRTYLCVHAVGGETGKTLTKARREHVRREHNKKVGLTGNGRCSLHVMNWRKQLLACKPVAAKSK